MRARCCVSSIHRAYAHRKTEGGIAGDKSTAQQLQTKACKEKPRLVFWRLLAARLQRRRGNAWLELSLATLPEQVTREAWERRRIVDPADPDAVGTELPGTPHLVGKNAERDGHRPLESLCPIEHAEYVRRVRFPDAHVKQDDPGLDAFAQLLHVLVGKRGLRLVATLDEQLLIGDRLARVVLEDEEGGRA